VLAVFCCPSKELVDRLPSFLTCFINADDSARARDKQYFMRKSLPSENRKCKMAAQNRKTVAKIKIQYVYPFFILSAEMFYKRMLYIIHCYRFYSYALAKKHIRSRHKK